MELPDFKLERYFERYEFSVPYLLSSSDAETLRLDELLALADEEMAALWSDLRLGYTEVRGHPLLRAAIASLYEAVEAEDVRAALRPNTRLIALNAPNSPTGSLPTEAELRELFALGPRVFVDEVYRLLEHDQRDRLPAAADLGGVSLGVLSKSFGLAGLRIGWLATRDAELRERIVAFKHYLTICSAAPSELLATIALRARDTLLARSRAIIDANLAVLDDFFARRDDFAWVRPRAGTTGLVELRLDAEVEDFARRIADAEGVMLLPAGVFDWPGNSFRIGYARADMPAALERLERFSSTAGRTSP